MTTSTNTSNWLTKQAAADAIGVSVKTIENLGATGKIASVIVRDPYRARLYSPDDVQREAARRKDAGSPNYTGPELITPLVQLSPDSNVARVPPVGLLELVARQLTTSSTSSTSISTTKLCLTIPEAAEFAGLSETFIRRLCIDGTLGSFRDGRTWKIRRAALVALYGAPQPETR